MAKKIKIDEEFIIIEECPICKSEIEPNLNDDGFVEAYYCSVCSRCCNLEDFKIVRIKIQKSILEFGK